MKIVAGLGSVDDYIAYVEAGADEVFVGYVPEAWQLNYGLFTHLNRREVCYYNVQLGSRSELEILSNLVEKYKVPVTIAFNGLHFTEEQFPLIADIMEDCLSLGFTSFIVADYVLLIYLKACGLADEIRIHISGEMGEINSFMLMEYQGLGMSRIIWHRKVLISDMKAMNVLMNEGQKAVENEAFLMNEKCRFHGGFCNSLHCDELVPMCRMPYKVDEFVEQEDDTKEKASILAMGSTGCGLCKLWQLKEAGVTHLKVVGRGLYVDDMLEDIRGVKKALAILEKVESEEAYRKQMKSMLFLNGCSKNCYYE